MKKRNHVSPVLLYFLFATFCPTAESVTPGTIKLCLEDENSQPIENAYVACYYDDDIWDTIFLASGYTESNGCIHQLNDWWDSNPDLYCKISVDRFTPTITNTPEKSNWDASKLADFGTLNLSYAPTPSPSDTKVVKLDQADIVDLFTDWRVIGIGVATSAILTAPAISVYFRNTEERPTRSYFCSCVVKLCVSYLTGSTLVNVFDGIGNLSLFADLSLFAAVTTELVEFLFDFGRLVLFFSDPGKMDFYHNVRWNSGVSTGISLRCFGLSFLKVPLAVLMMTMWLLVLYSNFDTGLLKLNFSTEYGEWWLLGFQVYCILASSFTGAYYLLRMCCPRASNEGEEQGVGYFWSRFKVIAVDAPSLISTGLVNPSSLIIFWSAEFINDIFPFVASFVLETYCLKEKEDEDYDKDGEGEITDDVLANEERGRIANEEVEESTFLCNEKGEAEITDGFLLEGNITNDNEEGGQVTEGNKIAENDRVDVVSNDEGGRSNNADDIRTHNGEDLAYHIPFLDSDKCAINRRFPSILRGQMAESEWSRFCDKIGAVLESIVPVPDICIKTVFIVLAVFASGFYWWHITIIANSIASINFNEDSGGTGGSSGMPEWLFYFILCTTCVLGGWTCFKACFGNLPAESNAIDELERVCSTESAKRSNVNFHVVMEHGHETVMKWCCRGGFSCSQSINSIQNIKCSVTLDPDTMEQGPL